MLLVQIKKTIITTLENLQEATKYAERPAVLVFGKVVNLSEILHLTNTENIRHETFYGQ